MPSEESVFEIVWRGGTRSPGSWIGIVAPSAPDASLLAEFLEESRAQSAVTLSVIDVVDLDPYALGQQLQEYGGQTVLLFAFDTWPASKWRSAEWNRNTWLREGGLTYFFLGPRAAANLSIHAPNLRSLLGAFLRLAPEHSQMTEDDRRVRLDELRGHYEKTDADVLEAATSGRLELTPHMVEWLILLNRGDLV